MYIIKDYLNIIHIVMDTLKLDKDINPWLEDISNTIDKTLYLNNLLNIGFTVSTQLNLNTNNHHTEKILDLHNKNNKQCMDNLSELIKSSLGNFSERLLHIEQKTTHTVDTSNNKMLEMVEKLTGKIKTSSIRGEIGENAIQDELEKNFINDKIIRCSSQSHVADIQIIPEDGEEIIIESKNYTGVVPSKEIEKFKKDMNTTNINYGIFISFHSKITGKKNFEIEQYDDDKFILYLSNIEQNLGLVSLGANLMKRISKIVTTNKDVIHKNLLKNKIKSIHKTLKKLPKLISFFKKKKTTLVEEEINIRKALDNIHSEFLKTEVNLKSVIDEIRKEINDKISILEDIDTEDILDIEDLVENIESKKKDQIRPF